MVKLYQQQGQWWQMGVNQHKNRSENNKIVRKANMRSILNVFLDGSQATIEEAMERTCLSYPTVMSIFKGMLQAGLIDKFGYAESTGGRQAFLYSLNPNCGYSLGIHLSNGTFSMAITNLKGGIIYEHREEIVFELAYLGTAICGLLDTALDHTGIQRHQLLAAGLCLSCEMRSRLAEAGVDLRRQLEEAWDFPIKEISEPSIQSYLDKNTFQVLGLTSFLYLSFDQAITVNLVTAEGPSLELGGDLEHITLVPNGALCRCGRRGCLKTYYDGRELWQYFLACCREAGVDHGLPAEDEAPKNPLQWIRVRSQAGSLPAKMAVRHALNYLSLAIGNIIVATGIGSLVISGLFTSRDADLVHQLSAEIREKLPEEYREKLQIEIGFAQPENSAIGLCQIIGSMYYYKVLDGVEQEKR